LTLEERERKEKKKLQESAESAGAAEEKQGDFHVLSYSVFEWSGSIAPG